MQKTKQISIDAFFFVDFFSVGFTDTTTIEQLCADFPELDMVDHTHRTQLVKIPTSLFYFSFVFLFCQCELLKTKGLSHRQDFRPIEGKKSNEEKNNIEIDRRFCLLFVSLLVV